MIATFCALSVLLSLCSLAGALYAVRNAIQVRESLQVLKPLSASRIKSLETSVEELQSALTDVANRVKMQRVRNAANHVGNGAADPYQNPEKWRAEMNRKLAFGNLGVKQ